MAKYKRNYKSRAGNSTSIQDEIQALEERIQEESPQRGYAPPLHQKIAFRSLPLSEATLRGLEQEPSSKKKSFTTMTAIQNACIPHALAGRDILGAARTGSGKTLAFLIPLLECLYRNRFSPSDGPGGIVLSPTRELAVQIFQVVRGVGAYHQLSAGLLVGGKKEFYAEQNHVGRTNIIIATPGRLLQHLEQTPDLDTTNVRMLVLDEADRILDMGFREQMIRILEYLPPGNKEKGGRQTLLFSATQTKKVSDLAALSLHRPEYLGVHDKEKSSTPESLAQSMVVVPIEHKLNAVYSFLKSHLRCKIIIFMASCSQVRHAWELFCALQPGIPVMALHGKLVQEKRTKIYFDFLQRPHAVLFATDVAARGLDFPNVDWVVQVDAPEDKEMYIHRVGRTARNTAEGKSLLMLTPGEEKGMTQLLLKDGKLPLKKLSINPSKTVLVSQRAASLVASNARLNTLAKKAFKSYTRSIQLMPNKDVFNVESLDLDAYASSLGLAATPSTRFLHKVIDRTKLRSKKNINHKLHKLKEQIKAEKLAKKIEKVGAKRSRSQTEEIEPKADDDLLVVKAKHRWGDSEDDEDLPDAHLHEVSKSRHPKKIRVESGTGQNKRIVFDNDGNEQNMASLLEQDASAVAAEISQDREDLETANEDYMRQVRERLQANTEKDRSEEKERVREKHRKKRQQEKGEKDEEDEEGMVVTLGGGDDTSEEADASSGTSSSSDDDSEDEGMDVKMQEELALAMIRGK